MISAASSERALPVSPPGGDHHRAHRLGEPSFFHEPMMTKHGQGRQAFVFASSIRAAGLRRRCPQLLLITRFCSTAVSMATLRAAGLLPSLQPGHGIKTAVRSNPFRRQSTRRVRCTLYPSPKPSGATPALPAREQLGRLPRPLAHPPRVDQRQAHSTAGRRRSGDPPGRDPAA